MKLSKLRLELWGWHLATQIRILKPVWCSRYKNTLKTYSLLIGQCCGILSKKGRVLFICICFSLTYVSKGLRSSIQTTNRPVKALSPLGLVSIHHRLSNSICNGALYFVDQNNIPTVRSLWIKSNVKKILQKHFVRDSFVNMHSLVRFSARFLDTTYLPWGESFSVQKYRRRDDGVFLASSNCTDT